MRILGGRCLEAAGSTRRWAIVLIAVSLAQAASAAQLTESARLDVRDNAFEDRLGFTVDVTEEWALVGEPNDQEGSLYPGAAHFFRRREHGWELTQTVHPTDYAAPRQFGHSVALDGATAVIGDRVHSSTAVGRGAAYILELSGGAWVQAQKLEPPQEDRKVFFGQGVAVDGDWVAVYAEGDAELYEYHGAVYLYERTPASWELRAKVIPRDPLGQPVSSASMAFQEGVLCVGDVSLAQVYVFEQVGSSWHQTAILHDPTPIDYQDNFGCALAYDDGVLVVGNRVDQNPFQTRSGSALVYERLGPGSWVFHQELKPSIQVFGPPSTDSFGRTVAVEGDRVLVGAHWGLNEVGVLTGSAYLFERDPNGNPTWIETSRLTSSREYEGAGIGTAVALSRSFALVGASAFIGATPGVKSGTAFVYDLPLGTAYCPAETNSTGAGASLTVTGSLSATVGALELRAENVPPGQVGLFLASRTEGFVPHPGGSSGNLCLGSPLGRFTGSLSSSGPAGVLLHTVDMNRMPLEPQVPVLPGESWSFQAWFHDLDPGPTSNFSNAVTVVFE